MICICSNMLTPESQPSKRLQEENTVNSELDRRQKTFDRRTFIGGSDARIILGNDEAALLRLWREKRGDVEPEDLSGDLLVQLGTVTEHLNRHWYEKNTGHLITEVQRQVFNA